MAGLASQQAVAASTRVLLTQAATLGEDGLVRTASDLAGVAELLAAQPHLRRLLTETTSTAEAKAGLISRLVGDRIGAAAQRVVAEAVGQRWSHARDLVDGLRRLADTAVFLQAERSGDLDDVEDQLFRFGRIVDAQPELSVILDDPATPADGRADLVRRVVDGKVHPLTEVLLTALAHNPGGRAFSHGVTELVTQAAERREQLVAIVTSAVALSPDEVGRLREALERLYSHPIAIHVIVDDALRGGLRVRVGDEVIDGSISGRLRDLQQRLARR